ncbi:hypothetical protein LTR10_002627 [Elasticomyces elasticus]|uniref:Nitrile-specifier protein 5 n=1 Tax=Elasticomyces elasticus TaxID=574655 RepID=A0AAN7ZKL1_9PEZI|nr:hypothetical protein LTR10_002627 [Elasticomyces elasticus]KAK5690019.1 hypothetical protein LTR97_012503 [Elasticomyces elasticus]
MKATWTAVNQSELLQRSSHNVAVLGSKVYVFGGELKPRQPRDNDIFVLNTGDEEPTLATATSAASAESRRPSPRVGSAVAKLGKKLYFFSGRGGEAMAPVDEQGVLWVFDTVESIWGLECPGTAKVYPEARSYHAMTSDGKNTLYIHAGCPEKDRLSDLWAYDVHKQEWEQLASAPEPSRGGPSIAYAGDGRLGPGARSVGALLPVNISGGTHLITFFGESDPSSLGHQGAGKMLSDVWAYDITTGTWEQIVAEVEGGKAPPAARGWFDADVIETSTGEAVAVSGGLGEQNERLGDTWLLTFAS